jgi:hypothetical protein
MPVRIFFAAAVEPFGVKVAEPEVVRLQRRVLAGEDERRRKPAPGERSGDGSQLDCFRPGADNQPDIRETQPSP